jgi:hypothetical protein
MNVPRTIWVVWCHTCSMWLDETESADASARLAVDEHPDHLDHVSQREEGLKRCRVEVIPFRADRKAALRVVARAPEGVELRKALKDGSAVARLVRPKKRSTKRKGR